MNPGDDRQAQALKARIGALPVAVLADVAAALEVVGADLVAAIRHSLAAAGSGGRDGARSVPGAPPADPTGRLAASLSVAVDPEAAAVTVTAAIPYAVLLEYGTRHMAPRPFLRPAVEALTEAAQARLGAALARAVSRTFEGAA